MSLPVAFLAGIAAACLGIFALACIALRQPRRGVPGDRHYRRAVASVDARHAPVTRELPLSGIVIPLHDRHVAAHDRCPWCPVTTAEGARDGATRDDCNCKQPCGEEWCARKPYMQEARPW